MSSITQPAERIAAAGCARAAVSPVYVGAVSAAAGTGAFATALFRGWGSNPTTGMQAKATKRHDLTPAPRPEDGSP